MDRALYTSMTGAKHNMLEQAVRSHNLANVSTVGFKADLANAISQPINGGNGYDSRIFSVTQTPATDLRRGDLIETNRELDIAISGDGWLALESKTGEEVYSRGGNLSVDSFGILRNEKGLAVIGNAGPILIPEAEKIEIGIDGTITARALGQGPEALVVVDRLKLVNPDSALLTKQDDGLIHSSNDIEDLDPNIRVQAGFLESSNVSAVGELTAIMSLARQFEMQIKMMQTVSENAQSSARILQVQV